MNENLQSFKYFLFLKDDKSKQYLSYLLNENPNNLLYNYYDCFINNKDINLELFFTFEYNEDELNEMLFHLNKEERYNNIKKKIFDYFCDNNKKKYLNKSYEFNNEIINIKKDYDLPNINFIEKKKSYIVLLIFDIVFVLLMGIFSIFIKGSIRYQSTILLFVIPCLLLNNRIWIYINKKANIIFKILGVFILLYIISFIFLIDIQDGIFDHFMKVVRSSYDFLAKVYWGMHE